MQGHTYLSQWSRQMGRQGQPRTVLRGRGPDGAHSLGLRTTPLDCDWWPICQKILISIFQRQKTFIFYFLISSKSENIFILFSDFNEVGKYYFFIFWLLRNQKKIKKYDFDFAKSENIKKIFSDFGKISKQKINIFSKEIFENRNKIKNISDFNFFKSENIKKIFSDFV